MNNPTEANPPGDGGFFVALFAHLAIAAVNGCALVWTLAHLGSM